MTREHRFPAASTADSGALTSGVISTLCGETVGPGRLGRRRVQILVECLTDPVGKSNLYLFASYFG